MSKKPYFDNEQAKKIRKFTSEVRDKNGKPISTDKLADALGVSDTTARNILCSEEKTRYWKKCSCLVSIMKNHENLKKQEKICHPLLIKASENIVSKRNDVFIFIIEKSVILWYYYFKSNYRY